MSPSWRDRLLVALAPERVAAVRLRRGLKPAVAADRVRDCPPLADPVSPVWSASLVALDGLLDEPELKGGASVSVVLSNQFVRYGTVPWTEGVYSEDDRKRLAAGLLQTVHGEVVDQWRIVLDPPRYGCETLAAAMDDALVSGLRETLGRHRLRLASLRPHLEAAYDHWRTRLSDEDGGFVLLEPGCVTGLFRRQDRWAEVNSRRYPAGNAAAAEQILRQCVEADGVQGGGGTVALLAPGIALAAEPVGERIMRCLEGAGGPWPEDPWRSMAWSAA